MGNKNDVCYCASYAPVIKLIPLDYDEVAEQVDISNMEGAAVYSSRVIMVFKAKTEECFQPIDGLGATEIEDMVEEYVNAKFS